MNSPCYIYFIVEGYKMARDENRAEIQSGKWRWLHICLGFVLFLFFFVCARNYSYLAASAWPGEGNGSYFFKGVEWYSKQLWK